jgi:hypothetical protein
VDWVVFVATVAKQTKLFCRGERRTSTVPQSVSSFLCREAMQLTAATGFATHSTVRLSSLTWPAIN